MHECPTKVTSRGRETLIVVGALAALLAIYAPIYLPYLPNGKGGLGSDYSLWLPDLLAGYFWYLKNGLWALPWYSPSQCGGIPFYADPQVPYLSVPQFLTFVMPPVEAVQTSFLLFAAAGFLGAFRRPKQFRTIPAGGAAGRYNVHARPHGLPQAPSEQKFFGSFFQKRTASFPALNT